MITSKRKSDKNPRTPRDPYITQERTEQLKKRKEELIKVVRPKLSQEVARLADLGDFSENAAYQLAKSKLRGVNNKILTIEDILKHAIIIKPTKSKVIQIGSQIIAEVNGIKNNYQILGSQESAPSTGKISHLSPIGSALIGHKKNDTVEIELEDRKIKYKIISVN